jgi:glyoxylase-like metal-dependent hydrolase (beta-lactamase superfamily II)/rhodanese-related sulfurtransferase
MKVEQLYTGCLAEAAYYIESNGEAAIIDPLRETKPYTELAKLNGTKIKYILETHFHADFVSGHLDLAKKTGATIVYGPTAVPAFDAHIAKDNEELKLGDVTIKVLHTPGHTMESSTFLLIDENGKDHALFTGDTLFIGDVGRPDLAVKNDLTKEDLAGYLYDSLHNKIMPLADDVIVYPGHGAGSACGKNMSLDTVSTLGLQKKFNYALRPDLSKEQFIKEVTDGLVEPPQYFPKDVGLNKNGYASIDDIIAQGTRPFSANEFLTVWESTNALVIDTRSKNDFPKAFVPGSIFIGIEDKFAPWAGALINDMQQPILIIADEGREEEVVIRLARVGYDHTLGYLKGGMNAWIEAGFEIDTLQEIAAKDFEKIYNSHPNTTHLIDTRKESEFNAQHLVGAENFPLDFINRNMSMLKKEQTYYLHCAGGYRSVIACSILKSRGFNHVVNIQGGFKALSETQLSKTSYTAPKTML